MCPKISQHFYHYVLFYGQCHVCQYSLSVVMQWWCNDGGDDKYNDFLDGDDHNDYMMMSITLKVRVRPEDSGKQMICQVKKTKHENLHIFLFSTSYFGYIYHNQAETRGVEGSLTALWNLTVHCKAWWCDLTLSLFESLIIFIIWLYDSLLEPHSAL